METTRDNGPPPRRILGNTSNNRCKKQEIIRRINEEMGIRAMTESNRVRESMIRAVKEEIMKYREKPEYRDNKGLRYLERRFNLGKGQQHEEREFRDIKAFLEERMNL